MKFFTGCVLAAGLVLVAAAAQAQVAPDGAGRPAYTPASDVGAPTPGPYAAMPPEAPRPGYGPGYGNGPTLLPPIEVYTVVRESGFSPLGVPHLRGFIYRIAVVDRSGADGRLVIDARDGRVLRLVRRHGMGDNFNDDFGASYGLPATLPPMTEVRGAPRPPRSVPHVASRTVPVPKANPLAAKPAAGPEPEPLRSVAPPKSAEAQTSSPPAAATTGAAPARPAPQIAPTQDMPVVQGLE
jgi:hypothetical protein